MAINYDKSYNAEIRKAVRHYNQVRKTLSKHGIKLASAPIRVSELKARYQTRRDLNRELALLKKVSSSDDRLLRKVENQGGVAAIKWNLDYLKLNEKKAIDYFERQKEIELKKEPMFAGERMRLNAIEQKLQYLRMDVNYMNQNQFKSYSAIINEYLSTPSKIKGGYRGFLSEVESVMRMTGFNDTSINSVFKKLKVLTPSEFDELYQTSELVKRIYELADSPVYENGIKLNTTKDNALELIDAFIESLDSEIAKVKNK